MHERTRTPVHCIYVVGTRPEAIKMLPVILAAREDPDFHPVVVSTGQHAELVREVLALGDVEPDVTFDSLTGAPGSAQDLRDGQLGH